MAGYRARQIAIGLAAAATLAVHAQDEQPPPTSAQPGDINTQPYQPKGEQ